MKTKFIIYSLLVVLFCSCEDYLDRQPLNEYSNSSLWQSKGDAEAALNSCYRGWEMTDGSWMSNMWLFYMDCASDNAFSPYPWEGAQMLGNMMLLTPLNVGRHKWDFSTIRKTNWFLENIDEVPIDENLIKRMKGEARFLRAYKYFIMSQLYGDVPLITTQITTEEANSVTRTNKAEVVKFVLDELAAITADLPESYSGDNVGRITRGAAWALKARVELFNEKYEECVASYNNVLGKYTLFPDYADLFRIQNENNSEIILDVQFIKNDVPQDLLGVMFPHISNNGWYSVDPTESLVNAYEMKNGKTIDDPISGYDPEHPYENRDPRLYATVIVPGKWVEGGGMYWDPLNLWPNNNDYYLRNPYTGFGFKKYTAYLSDFDDIWNTGLNVPVIRYAEVLLSYAEAKIELNQIDNSVYEAIDKLRERVGMPVVDQSEYNTQTKMRELIRRERRVELAMEGLRWFDIQRWRIGEEVMNGPVYGSKLGTVDQDTGGLTLTEGQIQVEVRVFDGTMNYLWPIPQSEIDLNPNLTQNSGY